MQPTRFVAVLISLTGRAHVFQGCQFDAAPVFCAWLATTQGFQFGQPKRAVRTSMSVVQGAYLIAVDVAHDGGFAGFVASIGLFVVSAHHALMKSAGR